MSPRQDTYLSLCLEQASKSPLHYHHGCIIVRGGKVIGRGFNHYRPGFNGGALKNGRSKTASDMLVQQKPKHMNKFNRRDEDLHACGGRAGAHMALSMHAEMMAIRSALSLSSHPSGASARSNAWYEKPCFKSPGLGKKERRLRKEKIRQYVERVCKTTEKTGGKIESDGFTTQKDVWRFEPDTRGLLQAQQQCSQPAWSQPDQRSEVAREEESFYSSASVRSRPVPV
ncbi:hypothetical protein GJ744_011957 [Endocarpon pusillum]|uniref:CMP/dCMP-type deaminase domain-containing protein n=1 Tax=Endocarpon pusillum TaxID=364733 RepID=A0A8H7ASQ3_9EURO|nr:hypothetical protein GJ744_011957 [Endocarpon pusillum]